MTEEEYCDAIVQQAVEDSISELSDILRAVVGSLSLYREKLSPAESAQTAAERKIGTEAATILRDELIAVVVKNLPSRLKTLDIDDRILDHEKIAEDARKLFMRATDIDL